MRHLLTAAAVFALATAPCAAIANDGFAGLDAGGIVFEQTDAVRMVSEDLRIGLDEIAVAYVFRNTTAAEVTGRVAFPIPAFFPGLMAESDVNGRLREGDPANPLGFTVMVEGRSVPFATEFRYYLGSHDDPTPAAREVSDRLRALGIPQALQLEVIEAWFKTLPAETRAALIAEGLFQEVYDGVVAPQFSVQMTHHWQQSFPAGRDLSIAHRYRPIPSGSVPGLWEDAAKTYCIDAGTRKGLEKIFSKMESGALTGTIYQYYLTYILTTANTWAGPIERFKLTLDKGRPNAIISLCVDGIVKTGPTTFVVEKTDFRPAQDLQILLVWEE